MCYDVREVNTMENEHLEEQGTTEEQTGETTGYTPRPRWQVWAARVGLVLFILVLILYYIQMFWGGL